MDDIDTTTDSDGTLNSDGTIQVSGTYVPQEHPAYEPAQHETSTMTPGTVIVHHDSITSGTMSGGGAQLQPISGEPAAAAFRVLKDGIAKLLSQIEALPAELRIQFERLEAMVREHSV